MGALSGGQRQTMALLMATMTPVDLLILDEHTAALDPKTAERIMELTDEIVKKETIDSDHGDTQSSLCCRVWESALDDASGRDHNGSVRQRKAADKCGRNFKVV